MAAKEAASQQLEVLRALLLLLQMPQVSLQSGSRHSLVSLQKVLGQSFVAMIDKPLNEVNCAPTIRRSPVLCMQLPEKYMYSRSCFLQKKQISSIWSS